MSAAAPLDAPEPESEQPTPAALLAARPHLRMHAMDGLLLEGVPLRAIADAHGTPCWVYGGGSIRARYRALAEALADALAPAGARIHYAVKANDHLAILDLLRRCGAGADVVSDGELLRARAAGIAASDIVFSGVGKSRTALRLALAEGVGQINVESEAELDMVSEAAAELGVPAPVALRINPDVDAGTHPKITTGRAENKFGIAYRDAAALYGRACATPGLRPVGLALHIGSQILSMAPYRAAFARAASLVRELRGQGLPVARLDCGGGLGIGYGTLPGADPRAFAGAVAHAFAGLDLALSVEPGRWLVGPAGVLLAAVILTKQTGPDAAARRFVVLDAAMNDLLRPALYDAFHGIVPLDPAHLAAPLQDCDVVGPVCESGDTFARRRLLPLLPADARVAILDAGAYGAVMSSTYNARPLAAQVLVDGDRFTLIRARQAPEQLWAGEIVP
jgi:diaminopimelate decarboxylase